MRTFTLSCTHCGRVMAVAETHLGHSVRCPHCQEVVATAAAPEGPPPLQPLSEAEEEQVFGRIEDTAPPVRPDEPHLSKEQLAPWQEEATPWSTAAVRHEPRPPAFPEGPAQRAPIRRTTGWLMWLVIIPLISYAILSTIVIIIQYQRLERLTSDLNAARPSSDKSTARP